MPYHEPFALVGSSARVASASQLRSWQRELKSGDKGCTGNPPNCKASDVVRSLQSVPLAQILQIRAGKLVRAMEEPVTDLNALRGRCAKAGSSPGPRFEVALIGNPMPSTRKGFCDRRNTLLA